MPRNNAPSFIRVLSTSFWTIARTVALFPFWVLLRLLIVRLPLRQVLRYKDMRLIAWTRSATEMTYAIGVAIWISLLSFMFSFMALLAAAGSHR